MACGCGRKSLTAGSKIAGYEVTYPDGTKAPGLFLTPLEAKKAIRSSGGGTIRQIVNG